MAHIRLAKLEELQFQREVLELHIALQEEGFVRHGETMPADHRARLEEFLISDLRDDPAVRIWIAYHGSSAVGILHGEVRYSTYLCRKTLYFQDLWVHPEFRGQGMGERLIRRGIKYACRKGFGRVELTTTANNRAAGALYRKLGFVCADIMADGSFGEWLTGRKLDPSKYAVLQKFQLGLK